MKLYFLLNLCSLTERVILLQSIKQQIIDSENNFINTSFWKIQPIFSAIMNADIAEYKNTFVISSEGFRDSDRVSEIKQKEIEYMAVSLINTFMIAAIQGGAYPPDANWIADQSLKEILKTKDPEKLVEIIRVNGEKQCLLVTEAKESATGNVYVEKAKQYIHTHLTQTIKINDIADELKISQSHLEHLFKEHTGKTMREHITLERIEAAKELLSHSNMSILEIASLLLFCDQSHFTQVFRRYTGMTPLQYRNTLHI